MYMYKYEDFFMHTKAQLVHSSDLLNLLQEM